MRIVFFGTSEFAEIILKRLTQEKKHEVVAVVTTPDTPQGRHLVLTPSPVKNCAIAENLPLLQPEKLKNNKEAFEKIASYNPDIIVVVAYGKILPKEILYLAKYKSVNVHGSILPQYRGAAPIQRAIMDKKKRLGVTVMYMNEGLDTGDIIDIATLNTGDAPFGEIHDKLAMLGAELLIKSLKKIEKGKISPEKQDDSKSTYAKKIEKSDTKLNFYHSAKGLHCKIRALSPTPLAMATLMTKKGPRTVKIVKSHYSKDEITEEIGKTVSIDGAIGVSCRFGTIYFDEIIPEGKGKMTAAEFIRGRGVNLGDIWK